ncbi:MAG: ribonuclease R [Lysobacteraceae bacterium]
MKKKNPGEKSAGRKPARSLPGWLPESLTRSLDESAAPAGKSGASARGPAAADGKAGKTRKTAEVVARRAALDDPHAEREARRYERPIASREALLEFLSAHGEPMEVEAIARALRLTAPDRFEALSRRLAAMVRDGQLLVNRRGGYAPAARLSLIPGVVIANADGFGFLRPDAGGDDLFLPPRQMRDVLHGDRVLAALTGVDSRGRREGAVVEVLERRTTRLVGRFAERDGVGLVLPDDRRVHQDIVVPHAERHGARSGQIVVCEITSPPQGGRPPFGRVLSVLGDALTPSLVVEMAIHGHDIPHQWPQEALEQASRVPLDVPAADIEGRVDLRELPLVTIDGETARDFDDAVYCETNRDGFRLVVAIADVSHYVRPGSAIDDEAAKRATSVYFPGFVVPMLPETLSNGICSLNPAVDRLCFVCEMQVSHDGVVTGSRFYEAVMRSHARLTYTQVWAAIGEDDEQAKAQIGNLLPGVQRLHQLYKALARQRARRGAIEFDSQEIEFRLGPAGEVVQAESGERNDAHKLIEECMVAANVAAARFLLESALPAPYRVHDRPPPSKYDDLLEFLKEFGLKLPAWDKVQPRDFTAVLKKARKLPEAMLLETVLLRSQALAVYQTGNIGHFGLALDAYAHFTSPIRRYPDLLVHRAIKHALSGAKAADFTYAEHEMAALALHCSECGRRADEAEREVDERYRCAWMERHIGAEFDGTVSGVTSFGVFVELTESRIDGLVHVTQLPNDYYHFDPLRKLMQGERGGLTIRLGDTVRVLVLRASLEERKIDFRLTEHLGEPVGPARGGERAQAGRPARSAKTAKAAKTDKPGKKRR